VGESIHPEVRIGHAHLKVADLDRATAFYHEVLGFDVVVYGPEYGVQAAFLTDPDGNGLELYRDRPRETWTDEEGKPIFVRPKKLELDDLLEELGPD
jgi:catechol-2,3-dioxygenase